MPELNTTLVLITNAKFWQSGAGFWARTQATIGYLARHVHLTVIYIDPVTETDLIEIRKMAVDCKIIATGSQMNDTYQHKLTRLQETLKKAKTADIYLIDKTENAYTLDIIPSNAIKLLDTHDIVHKRNKSTRSFNAPDGFQLTAQQERDLFARFDGVMCIQADDYNTVSQWQGKYKCLLVPHPLSIHPQIPIQPPTRIGIVASDWHANIHGLAHFIKHIWPKCKTNTVTLNLYGYVANAFKNVTQPNIHLHGFAQNITDCYKNIDIAINPVLYGAGLKIKTIEAMAHGIPLVTTKEGASGLLHLKGKAFLMANNDGQFSKYLTQLLNDDNKRKQISEFALKYVSEQLSEEQCFSQLLDFIAGNDRL